MNNGILVKNQFVNEKVLSYGQGSKERAELEIELAKIKNSFADIPIVKRKL